MFRPSLYLGDFDLAYGTIGTGSGITQLFKSNPIAVYRAVTNDTSNSLKILPSANFTSQAGVITIAAGATFEFYWERHGALVTLPFWFNVGTPQGNVEWLEMWWNPQGDIP